MSTATTAGNTQPGGSKYRQDLDGLRAIAVLAVIALHVGLLPALLATITYKYIEVPFRSPVVTKHIRPVSAAFVILMAVFGLVGYATYTGAIPSRSLPAKVAAAYAAIMEQPNRAISRVQVQTSHMLDRSASTRTAGPKRVLFVGDSTMEQYQTRIAKLIGEYPGIAHEAVFVTSPNCVAGIPALKSGGHANQVRCARLAEATIERAAGPDIGAMIIGASWERYPAARPTRNDALLKLGNLLQRVVHSGRPVYVILNLPVTSDMNPRVMIERTIMGSGFHLATNHRPRSDVLRATRAVNTRIRDIAERSGATVIDPMEWLCDEIACPTAASDDRPVYQDRWQISPHYMRDHVRFLDAILLDQGFGRTSGSIRAANGNLLEPHAR